MRNRRMAVSACLGIGLVTSAGHATEREWHLGGGAGLASFMDGKTSVGPAVGVHAAYGLSDMFDLRLAVLGATNAVGGERFWWQSATAGLIYKLDVIAWVPYFGASIGYYHLGGEVKPLSLASHQLGASFDFGLDYAVTRNFGVGAECRLHGLLSKPLGSITDAPLFTGLIRAEYRWGW